MEGKMKGWLLTKWGARGALKCASALSSDSANTHCRLHISVTECRTSHYGINHGRWRLAESKSTFRNGGASKSTMTLKTQAMDYCIFMHWAAMGQALWQVLGIHKWKWLDPWYDQKKKNSESLGKQIVKHTAGAYHGRYSNSLGRSEWCTCRRKDTQRSLGVGGFGKNQRSLPGEQNLKSQYCSADIP